MRRIPFTKGAVILSGEEKVRLAQKVIEGAFAKAALEATISTVENTTALGSALSEALNIGIEALQTGSDSQVALDQMQAILTSTYAKCYGEEALASL
jgi:ribonuclease HI